MAEQRYKTEEDAKLMRISCYWDEHMEELSALAEKRAEIKSKLSLIEKEKETLENQIKEIDKEINRDPKDHGEQGENEVIEATEQKQIQESSVDQKTEEKKYMKTCFYCGKEIAPAAVVCPHCGCAVGSINTVGSTNYISDVPSTGLNVISFLFPLVGLILYLVYQDKTPNKANAVGKWALISVGILTVLYIILYSLL